eukprot:GEMP01021670.1.p1 GENE.GEMP01021670.1~~GEMP01021670.1.p1  ORF type:complete len:568 (+),score=108.03 GEMP01021670.1:177-1880(+)
MENRRSICPSSYCKSKMKVIKFGNLQRKVPRSWTTRSRLHRQAIRGCAISTFTFGAQRDDPGTYVRKALKNMFNGSLIRAWHHFDDDGIGRIGKHTFMRKLRSLQISGNIGLLWAQYFGRGRKYCTLVDFDERSADALFQFRNDCVEAFGSLASAFQYFAKGGALSKVQLEHGMACVGFRKRVQSVIRALFAGGHGESNADTTSLTALNFLWLEYQYAACTVDAWKAPLVSVRDVAPNDALDVLVEFDAMCSASPRNAKLFQIRKVTSREDVIPAQAYLVFEQYKTYVARRNRCLRLRAKNKVKLDAICKLYVRQRANYAFRRLLAEDVGMMSIVRGWRLLEKKEPYSMRFDELVVSLRRRGFRLNLRQLWAHVCKDRDKMTLSDVAPTETKRLIQFYKELRKLGTMHNVFRQMSNSTRWVDSEMLDMFLRRYAPSMLGSGIFFDLSMPWKRPCAIAVEDLLWLEGLDATRAQEDEHPPKGNLGRDATEAIAAELIEGYFALEKEPYCFSDENRKNQICLGLLQNLLQLEELKDVDHMARLSEVYLVIFFLVLCKPSAGLVANYSWS